MYIFCGFRQQPLLWGAVNHFGDSLLLFCVEKPAHTMKRDEMRKIAHFPRNWLIASGSTGRQRARGGATFWREKAPARGWTASNCSLVWPAATEICELMRNSTEKKQLQTLSFYCLSSLQQYLIGKGEIVFANCLHVESFLLNIALAKWLKWSIKGTGPPRLERLAALG